MNNQVGLENEMYIPGQPFLDAYAPPNRGVFPQPGFWDAMVNFFGSFGDALTLNLFSTFDEDEFDGLEEPRSIDDFSETDGHPPKVFVANTLDGYFRLLAKTYSESGTKRVSLGTRAGFEGTVAMMISRRIPQLSPTNGLPELCEDLFDQVQEHPIITAMYELRVEEEKIFLFPRSGVVTQAQQP
ncbi:hypothetical protein HYV84_02625 [Candidatus Woesearchaeota archaeon]|nr:hypothetical protein [Candidatus Woesearchaeota archaeon]